MATYNYTYPAGNPGYRDTGIMLRHNEYLSSIRIVVPQTVTIRHFHDNGLNIRYRFYLCNAGHTTDVWVMGLNMTGKGVQWDSSFSFSAADGDGEWDSSHIGNNIYRAWRIHAHTVAENKDTGAALSNVSLKNTFQIQIQTKYSHFVSVEKVPFGTASADKVDYVTEGTQVTLTAVPDAGSVFEGWITSPAVTITNNKFTMPNSDVTIRPVFSRTSEEVLPGGRYNGSSFVPVETQYYADSKWNPCELHRYNGTAWETVAAM